MHVHTALLRVLLGAGLLAVWMPIAFAQSTPPAGVTIPPGAPDAVQEALPKPADLAPPLPVMPPAPPRPTLQTPVSPSPQTAPDLDVRFPVERIIVEASTVLQAQIAELVAEYEARGNLTFEEVLELRSRITQLYFDQGYVTSGAYVPNNQLLSDGVIRIRVIEGELEALNLCLLAPGAGQRNADLQDAASPAPTDSANRPEQNTQNTQNTIEQTRSPSSEPLIEQQPERSQNNDCGSARLQEGYIRSRLARASGTPVNQQRIEEALQLLQLDPLIQEVNAELTAGTAPGQNILIVQVREAPAFRFGLGGDNYQSPSIGSEQFSVQASYDNVLGLGDRISAGYGFTEGLDSVDVGYAIPLNPQDGTLSLSYSRDESLIVEQEFEDLDIRSDSETFSIGFRQPVIRKPQTEFALGMQVDLRRSTTFLEGEPFSFSLGPEDGESNIAVLRLSQDWVNRDARTVLAARSQFSIGLDAFDATVNDTGTDGRFFAWLGQFQWVQRLSSRWVLVSRLNAQLTPDSLLPLERFGYGGVDTVRGYQQNQLVTDNGVLAAVEARFGLLSDPNRLQLIPFVEAGHGWNNQFPDPDPATIASVGLGLRWAITPTLSLRLDYGIPLIDVDDDSNSLQDNGLYFSLRYQPF